MASPEGVASLDLERERSLIDESWGRADGVEPATCNEDAAGNVEVPTQDEGPTPGPKQAPDLLENGGGPDANRRDQG